MFTPCDERDSLWKEYDFALKDYTHAANEYNARPSIENRVAVQEAYSLLRDCRFAVRRHCTDHECDPHSAAALKD